MSPDTPRRRSSPAGLLALLLAALTMPGCAGPDVDAITFATAPGKLHVPLEEAAQPLGWKVEVDDDSKTVRINRHSIDVSSLRRLVAGSLLISLDQLGDAGAAIHASEEGSQATIEYGSRNFVTTAGAKRVEIDLANQRLRAWQGSRLVLETRISSGRGGSTPAGNFTAGPYKARMHYSQRYHNAPMPWSVQVTGHVFIHGFTVVPNYPASHGCIRLPLDGGNPARFFYEWVDVGTPIHVTR